MSNMSGGNRRNPARDGGSAAPGSPIEAVLFDMGGVLVELGPLDQLLGVADFTADEFWSRWLASPAVRALETGRCDVDQFAEDLVPELGLTITPTDVVERFTAFPRGLYPGAVELVESVADGLVTGLLSNTNRLHWEHQRDNEIIRSLFDRHYVSYRIGLLKPDRDLFDHVIADLGLAADRVLFIDDNRINVDGARAAGWRAEVAAGPAAAAEVLSRYGVVR